MTTEIDLMEPVWDASRRDAGPQRLWRSGVLPLERGASFEGRRRLHPSTHPRRKCQGQDYGTAQRPCSPAACNFMTGTITDVTGPYAPTPPSEPPKAI